MKNLILLILCFIISVSCSTKRSKYAPYKDDEGYKDVTENKVHKTSFKGNEATKAKDAEVFATFRAVELCHKEPKKLVHVIDVTHKTKEKEIIRSNGTGYNPSYYYGMSPFYGRYGGGGGFGLGVGMGSSTAWKEKLVYPEIEVTYECAEKVFGPKVVFRDVSADTMKLLVKDLKGGLQIEKIINGSPNAKAVEVGDIVLKIDGVRIEKNQDIQLAFNREPHKTSLDLEILREGVKLKAILTSTDITKDVQTCQDDVVKLACDYEEVKRNSLCQ